MLVKLKNMQYNIIPIKKEYKVHKISNKLCDLLNKTKDFQNTFFLFTSFCCVNYKNEKIIFFHNPKSDYCYYLDAKLDVAYIFFIKNFINEKSIDIKIAFSLLLIAEEIQLPEKKLFELFNILHWPSSKKGIDYLNAMKEFSDKLKGKIFKKKISLKEAYFFHRVFQKDYNRLLSLLPENFTFSQANEVIRNICEYSRKEKKGIDHIVKLLNNLDANSIMSLSYDLRYPLYSKYINIFESYIEKLNLPKGTRIVFDKTFEKEEYNIEIKYTNISTLLNKINSIKKSLDHYLSKDDNIDFFDHIKLFETNEEK